MRPIPGTEIEAFRADPKQYQAMKMLLDGLNGTRDALEVGNYADATQYGRWGALSFPAAAMVPGFSSPISDTVFSFYSWRFRVNDSLHSGGEVPADFISGQKFFPFFRASFNGLPVAAEVVTWRLMMNAAPRGGKFLSSNWSTDVTQVLAPADQYRDCVIRFPSPPLAFEPGGQFLFAALRVGAATTFDPLLLGVSFSYKKGPFGLEVQP